MVKPHGILTNRETQNPKGVRLYADTKEHARR